MHSAGATLMWHFLELNDLDGKLTHKGIFLFGTFLFWVNLTLPIQTSRN